MTSSYESFDVVKVKVESSPEPEMKSGGKKRSGEGAGGREKKSTKDYMKDLFYSSDEESVKEVSIALVAWKLF